MYKLTESKGEITMMDMRIKTIHVFKISEDLFKIFAAFSLLLSCTYAFFGWRTLIFKPN